MAFLYICQLIRYQLTNIEVSKVWLTRLNGILHPQRLKKPTKNYLDQIQIN